MARRRRVRLALAAICCLGVRASAHPVHPETGRRAGLGEGKFVPLADVARRAGFRGAAAENGRLDLVSLRGRTLRVESDRAKAIVDGVRVFLGEPVRRTGSRWVMGTVDAHRLLEPILQPGRFLHGKDVDWNTVVLDPGHGGVDSGAVSAAGMEEKIVALDLALRVKRRLEDRGLRVVLTREADENPSLEERVRIADRHRPFAFVSVHLNAAAASDAEGIETYVLSKAGQRSTNTRRPGPPERYPAVRGNEADAANAALGFSLHRELVRRSGAPDRGLRQARFYLLRQVRAPAVLVECGYLSNPGESGRLADSAYRNRLAEALADGILRFQASGVRARLASGRPVYGRPEKFFTKKVESR